MAAVVLLLKKSPHGENKMELFCLGSGLSWAAKKGRVCLAAPASFMHLKRPRTDEAGPKVGLRVLRACGLPPTRVLPDFEN